MKLMARSPYLLKRCFFYVELLFLSSKQCFNTYFAFKEVLTSPDIQEPDRERGAAQEARGNLPRQQEQLSSQVEITVTQ